MSVRRGLIAAGSAVALFAVAAANAGPDPSTLAGWRADLRLFAEQLPKRHANAFHHLSRAAFDREVKQLDQALPNLSSDGFWVGLDRIENRIGDGHTFMHMPDDAPTFGIAFARFGSAYRVVAIAPGEDQAPLGARLAAIDGKAIERIDDGVMTLTPADETDALRRFRAQRLLSNGLALHGLGITRNSNAVRYTFVDDDGHRFDRSYLARSAPPVAQWIDAAHAKPLARRGPESGIQCTTIAGATVYCNFVSYDDIRHQSAKVFAALDAARARRLIVDLRYNGGGNFCEGLDDIVRPIAKRPAINRDGGLYVLVGRQTFSAAMSNAAHFRQLTHAFLVGEPIGEKPDSYQEIDDLRLPHTGWTARYSTRLYRFSDGGENLIRPDIAIASTWTDYRAGRDAVLQSVLALPFDARRRTTRRAPSRNPESLRYCDNVKG